MTSRYRLSTSHGFLAPETAAIVAQIRTRFAPWFELADTANHLAMRVLYQVKPRRDDQQRFVEATLFGRALQSYQAAVVLAERGMTADARAVIRSACESVIIQMKVARDPAFVDTLVERHVFHRRALGNAWLSDPRSRDEMGPDEVTKVQAAIDELTSEHPGARDINLASVAQSIGIAVLYNAIYRPTSGDGAHATFDSLTRHVLTDAEGEVSGLRFGPDDTDLPQTLFDALNVLFHGLGTAIERYALKSFEDEFQACFSRWKLLMPGRSESSRG